MIMGEKPISCRHSTNNSLSIVKVIIAPDSFKECLSASRVAAILAEEICVERPGWEIVECPLSDGGEGFSEIVTAALGGRMETANVTGPTGHPVTARFGIVKSGIAGKQAIVWEPDSVKAANSAGETGIIEAAAACGLSLIPPDKRNPLLATSQGVGELMMAAYRQGCREFIIGLGGTATCDGGEGLLSAPGLRALAGKVAIRVLCDVANPFVGPSGAARVFAPQKGADAEMVEILEDKMVARARKMAVETGIDVTDMPGAGAAGGIAGALAAYFGARLEPGIDAVLDCIGFPSKVSGAEWIITGEGRSDRQTLSGKVPMGVLRQRGTARVALLSGSIRDRHALLAAGFDYIDAVTPEAISEPLSSETISSKSITSEAVISDASPLAEALRPDIAAQNLRLAIRRLLCDFITC